MSPKLENTWAYEQSLKHNSDPIGVHPGKGPNRVRHLSNIAGCRLKGDYPSPGESEPDEARRLMSPKLENTWV